MKYAVNPEGVNALNALAISINEGTEAIKKAAEALDAASGDNSSDLGPHKASIDKILEEIKAAEAAVEEPANKVAEKLISIAESYQDIIDNDPFSNQGN